MPSPPAAADTGPWATSSERAALIWLEPQHLLKKLSCQHLKSGYSTKKPGLGLHEVSEPLLVWPSLLLGALQSPVCQPPPGSVKEKPTLGDEVACTWAMSSSTCNPVSLTEGPGQGQAAPARVLPWPVFPLLELSSGLLPVTSWFLEKLIQVTFREAWRRVCPVKCSKSTGSEGPTSGRATCRPEPHIPRVAVWS